MNSLVIKLIALFTMSIDHIGLIILNDNLIFRFFGRMSFPLYGFLLVQGFNHTKNDSKRLIKYYISLFVVCLISEVIYDKLFFNQQNYILSQNIFFTLITSLICMTIYDKYSRDYSQKIISIMTVILIAALGEVFMFDYGFFGVLLIFSFYLISNIKIKNIYRNILYVFIIITYILFKFYFYGYSLITYGVLLSLIPIMLYNGKKGYNSKIIKYAFYLYYPLHLLILFLIKQL